MNVDYSRGRQWLDNSANANCIDFAVNNIGIRPEAAKARQMAVLHLCIARKVVVK